MLCCAATLYADAARGSADAVRLAAMGSDATRGRAPVALAGRALADVKQLYQRNPELVKEFALLTGSTGQRLLSEVDGATKPAAPRVFKGPSLHTLDNYMQQLTRVTEEQVRGPSGREERHGSAEGTPDNPTWQVLGTAEVNKRTAWMMVSDLSSDWDKNSNYSATPWEFCAGRNLSPRQIRECTGHLIRVAGVHSHRDLNMNAKIYDRFCTGDGHQFIDKYGSPILLPVGSRAMCTKIVTARTNVDALLKRQVTMYKEHRDRVTGSIAPAKWEIQGSHGINCHLIPDGC